MKRISLALLCGGVSFGLAAADSSHVWNPSERRAVFGMATVGYSESADTVTNVAVVAPAADTGSTVVFTGENAFEFAEGAKVSFDGGNLRLETPVTGGGISVVRASPAVSSVDAFDDWLYGESNPVLVFPGKQVADIEFDNVCLWSGAILKTDVYSAEFVRRTDTTLSAEFQVLEDGIIKGVRVTLQDGEGGICAYVNYARWCYGRVYQRSFDDLGEVTAAGGRGVMITRTSSDASGYGVRSVSVHRRTTEGSCRMTVSGGLYTASSASVGSGGVSLVLDNLAEGSTLENFSIESGGMLKIRDMERVNIAGAFAANGGKLAFEQSVPEPEEYMKTFSTNVAPALTSTTSKLLVENVGIADLVSYSVPHLTMQVSESLVPIMCYVVTNAAAKIIQFQEQVRDGSWCKGTVLEIYENGGDLHVRRLQSSYWNPSLADAGTVDLLNPHITLANTFTTSDYVRPKSFDLVCRADTMIVDRYVTVSLNDAATKVVLPAARIADVKAISVDHLLGNMSSTTTVPFYCYEKRTGESIDFQLQIDDGGWTKGSRYILYQNGDSICGYKVKSWWTKAHAAGAKDVTDPDYSITGGSTTVGSYYLEDITFKIHKTPHMFASVAGMNMATASGLEVDVGANVTLSVGGGSTLPQNGFVNVSGTLAVTNSGAIGTGTITVFAGGRLSLVNNNAVANNTNQAFTFDGGDLLAMDGLSYMNTPTFMNGASVTKGSATGELRVGAKNLKWVVGGTSCSTCSVPIRCVSAPENGEFTMNWNVADATGDAGVDFWMNAGMTEFEDGNSGGNIAHNGGMIHRKTGAGTLRWGGQGTCTGVVQVVEGTLLLGANDALNPGTSSLAQLRAKQPVQLMGGTLAAEAFTTNLAQYVSVSTNASAIVLAEGASLSADAFAGFGEGGSLEVTLGEGATLRFGTQLSGAELRRIRVNSHHAAQDGDGNILDGGFHGMMLLFR